MLAALIVEQVIEVVKAAYAWTLELIRSPISMPNVVARVSLKEAPAEPVMYPFSNGPLEATRACWAPATVAVSRTRQGTSDANLNAVMRKPP